MHVVKLFTNHIHFYRYACYIRIGINVTSERLATLVDKWAIVHFRRITQAEKTQNIFYFCFKRAPNDAEAEKSGAKESTSQPQPSACE